MDQIEEYKQEITTGLQNLHNTIHRSPLFSSDQKKWKENCIRQVKAIKNNIQCFKEHIDELPANEVRHHPAALKEFNKKIGSYEDQYREKLRGESLFKGAETGEKQEENNAVQELIQKGDDTQGRIKNILVGMDSTVEEGIRTAMVINQELNAQIEQLDRIDGKVKDTKSNLKRAQKSIKYFLKALECDKCMMVLMLLNALALIAVIVLLVKQNS